MTGLTARRYPEDAVTTVHGYCPSCGRASLFVGVGGHITCSVIECHDPTAVDRALSDPLARFHIVRFGEDGFDVQHPLTERGEDLVACDLHQHIRSLTGPPVRPGRYIAEKKAGRWTWREGAA